MEDKQEPKINIEFAEELFSSASKQISLREYIRMLDEQGIVQYYSCNQFLKLIQKAVGESAQEFVKEFVVQFQIYQQKRQKNTKYKFPFINQSDPNLLKISLDRFIKEYIIKSTQSEQKSDLSKTGIVEGLAEGYQFHFETPKFQQTEVQQQDTPTKQIGEQYFNNPNQDDDPITFTQEQKFLNFHLNYVPQTIQKWEVQQKPLKQKEQQKNPSHKGTDKHYFQEFEEKDEQTEKDYELMKNLMYDQQRLKVGARPKRGSTAQIYHIGVSRSDTYFHEPCLMISQRECFHQRIFLSAEQKKKLLLKKKALQK